MGGPRQMITISQRRLRPCTERLARRLCCHSRIWRILAAVALLVMPEKKYCRKLLKTLRSSRVSMMVETHYWGLKHIYCPCWWHWFLSSFDGLQTSLAPVGLKHAVPAQISYLIFTWLCSSSWQSLHPPRLSKFQISLTALGLLQI